MSLQDYLAKNYLSKKDQKKLKRQKLAQTPDKQSLSIQTQTELKEEGRKKTTEQDEEDLRDAMVITESIKEPIDLPDNQELVAKKSEQDPMNIFITDKTKKKASSKYSVNRYKIKLGNKWDNVNRSNGYEQKLMDKKQSVQYLQSMKDYYDDDIMDGGDDSD